MKFLLKIILLVSFAVPTYATCIKVDGLEFEAISFNEFLMSKNGKNLGTIKIESGWYNAKQAKNFRFFTDKICDSRAERQIMIDGKKVNIYLIQLFSN